MVKKSLEDRFAAIQQYSRENHVSLDMGYDPIPDKWVAWDGEEQLTDPCDGFEELIEALEAHWQL